MNTFISVLSKYLDCNKNYIEVYDNYYGLVSFDCNGYEYAITDNFNNVEKAIADYEETIFYEETFNNLDKHLQKYGLYALKYVYNRPSKDKKIKSIKFNWNELVKDIVQKEYTWAILNGDGNKEPMYCKYNGKTYYIFYVGNTNN